MSVLLCLTLADEAGLRGMLESRFLGCGCDGMRMDSLQARDLVTLLSLIYYSETQEIPNTVDANKVRR